MKRAQFELMGLAIVVVIISFGIFLLLAFSLQEKEDLTEQFVEDQFSQNLLDALMKTSLEGCDGTVADLLAWSLEGQFPSNVPADSDCVAPDPPLAANQAPPVLADQLDAAVGTFMNRPYRFIVREYGVTEEVCSFPSIARCEADGFSSRFDLPYDQTSDSWCNPDALGQQSARAGRQWISLYPSGKAEAILWICR